MEELNKLVEIAATLKLFMVSVSEAKSFEIHAKINDNSLSEEDLIKRKDLPRGMLWDAYHELNEIIKERKKDLKLLQLHDKQVTELKNDK